MRSRLYGRTAYEFERCCVTEAARMVDAMRAIDDGTAGVALVLETTVT